jgi:antitoxin PrlF
MASMVQVAFKGTVTTTGKSEALRIEKALFKAHPEFKQRAKIRAHVIGPGSMIVTLDPDDNDVSAAEDEIEQDPIVAAYLSFLERDLIKHPDSLRPISNEELQRIQELTSGVTVNDNDSIPDDVTL